MRTPSASLLPFAPPASTPFPSLLQPQSAPRLLSAALAEVNYLQSPRRFAVSTVLLSCSSRLTQTPSLLPLPHQQQAATSPLLPMATRAWSATFSHPPPSSVLLAPSCRRRPAGRSPTSRALPRGDGTAIWTAPSGSTACLTCDSSSTTSLATTTSPPAHLFSTTRGLLGSASCESGRAERRACRPLAAPRTAP